MGNVTLRMPPGLDLNGTEYESKGRWRLANLVRFFRGSPQPVGGWTSIPLTTRDSGNEPLVLDNLPGIVRGMLSWRDNEELRWLAIGTTRGLFVFDGSEIYDITPTGLGPGEENAYFGDGFGAYVYNVDEYGTPRSVPISSLVQEPGAWTLSTWGQELIACANWDGRIFKWSPGPPADALATEILGDLGEVPQKNRAVLVSNERHLIAIGAGDWGGAIFDKNGRRVAWSTSEDYTEWTPSVTNSAGDLPLQSKGIALAGTKWRNEIIIWTDIDVHRMSYIGSPFYYSLQRLSPASGLASVNSHVTTGEFVFWTGPQGFYMYDGAVREITSDVSDYFRDDINRAAIGKIACGHNTAFDEIWVFYPSRESEEVDSYILWNYREGTWSVGKLGRSCWNLAAIWTSPIAAYPFGYDEQLGVKVLQEGMLHDVWRKVAETTRIIANVIVQSEDELTTYTETTDYEVDYNAGIVRSLSTGAIGAVANLMITYDQPSIPYSKLYRQEDGWTDDGKDRDIWLESAPIEIADGDNLVVATKLIQDTGREDDLDPVLNSDAVQIEFDTRLAPEGMKEIEGPYVLDTERGYTDVRFTARQVVMRLRQVKNELWRAGHYRLDVIPGSKR